MRIFHITDRGVDKRKIFLEKKDYFRFIHDLFEFNDITPPNNNLYFFNKNMDIVSPYIERKPRKLLVNIHTFSLMPNHYHLLLSPMVERGITLFMTKLNIGYAKYFNEKNERKGALFEGRYKSTPILSEAHFIHIPYYIHCNSLDLAFPEWRKRETKSSKEMLHFLEQYRWSGHLDYCGEKNFPSVTQRDFLLEYFGGTEGYKKAIKEWISDFEENKFDKKLLSE